MSDALKNSFDKYNEQPDDTKNKSSNDLLTKIEDYATSVGAKTKQKFTLALPNIEVPDSLKGLMDMLGDRLNAWLSSKINDLKQLAKDTVKNTIQAGKDFLYNLAKKAIDMVASRLYLPDLVYLAKVTVLYYSGQSLIYKNNAVRKVIVTKDMPLTLKWINFTLKIRYSILEQNQANSDLRQLTRYSCINSIDYILGDFLEEKKMFETIRSTYEKDSNDWKRYDDLIRRSEKFIYRWFKEMFVYSVGNLNLSKVRYFIEKYNISPRSMGTTDDLYSQAFLINSSDIDIIAPFWRSNQFGDSFLKANDMIDNSSKSTDPLLRFESKMDAKWGFGKGEKRHTYDIIPTPKVKKYIIPRNIYIKFIYVYLVDKGFFPNKILYNYKLYERLCYPTMDVFTEALDNALSNFNGMLGDLFEGTKIYDYTMEVQDILLDPTKVVYAQIPSYGQVLPAPSMDDAGNFIPPPSGGNMNNGGNNNGSGGGGSSGSGGSSGGNNGSNNDAWKPGGKPNPGNDLDGKDFDSKPDEDKINFINSIFNYYFRFIDVKEHYIVLKYLFDELEKGVSAGGDEKKKLTYRKLIETYITPLYLQPGWDYDEYWKNIIASTVQDKYTRLMTDIRLYASLSKYCLNYLKKPDVEAPPIKKEFLDLFIRSYNFLKEFMYDSVIKAYSELEIFELLVFAYNKFNDGLKLKWSKEQEKQAVSSKFEEFFTGATTDPEFSIRNWLKTIDDANRRKKVKSIIIYCDNAIADKICEQDKLKAIHEAILIEFLPAYHIIINGTTNKDIDIDDPNISQSIRDELEYGKSNWEIIIDFNNKLVTPETIFEYDDLSKTYPFWEKYFNLGGETSKKE